MRPDGQNSFGVGNGANTLSPFDMNVLAVYGAIQRGVSKAEALKKYHIKESDYDKNINRCLQLQSQ